MNICTKHHNKTAPAEDRGIHSEEPQQPSRTNGWSWPLHPLQILAWFTYFFFTVVGFGILIPLLPPHWMPAGYICTGVMFLCHLIVHLIAISMDPADDNVRAKNRPLRRTVFDRSKHAHVIENLHCYLCEVDVSPKSKHCSSCNKCVSNFDHHCKWLNNCVGGRNYWFFLNSILSAALGSLLVAIIAAYVFIEYYVNPMKLRTDVHFDALKNSTDVWFVFLPAAPIETQASTILALAALVVLLGLLTVILLGQLLGFHIYLNWNRLSTYEYIMRQRHRQESKDSDKDPDDVHSSPPKLVPFQNVSYGGSLIYTNPDLQVKNTSPFTLKRELPMFHGRRTSDNKREADHEPNLTPSPQQEEPERNPQKKRRKKKKKLFKVPEEVINDRFKDCSMDIVPAPSPEPQPAVPRSVFVPIPAFPSRSLPLLAQIIHNPIQAAGPPADYHTDSAESMDEIPVAQTRLGSAEVPSFGHEATNHISKSSLGISRQNLIPAIQSMGEHARPSEELHSKRKMFLRSLEKRQKFELEPKVPSVFVIESSTQSSHPDLDKRPSPMEEQSGNHKRKWSHGLRNGGEHLSTIVNGNIREAGDNTTAA
ncbi:palmitoyltransferase ZDHHC1-like isoform X2 [Ambystoma mexicanum]